MKPENTLRLLLLSKLSLMFSYFYSAYYYVAFKKGLQWLILVYLVLTLFYVLVGSWTDAIKRDFEIHALYRKIGIADVLEKE